MTDGVLIGSLCSLFSSTCDQGSIISVPKLDIGYSGTFTTALGLCNCPIDAMAVNRTLVSSAAAVDMVENLLSSLPENPLEKPAGEIWTMLLQSYSRPVIVGLGGFLLHEVGYFSMCLPAFLFQFIPYMNRFKIQQDKPETKISQWHCFKMVVASQMTFQMPFLLSSVFLADYLNIGLEWHELPRWYIIALKLYLCIVIEDAWFYFTHRLMHHNLVYKYVHKVHHKHQAPFGMAAEYTHPIETAVLGLGVMWGVVFFGSHLIIIWSWIILRLLETVDTHCGYDIPYINPLHLLPFYGGARFHDFHHQNFVGNYASTFTWWDWLFGTDVQYKEFCANKNVNRDKKNL